MNIKDLHRANSILIFIVIVLLILYFGAGFFIPLTFAIFFATLILPVSNLLEKKVGVGKITSSLISTLIIFFGVGLVFFSLVYQINIFVIDLIDRKDDLINYFQQIQKQIAATTGFSPQEQEQIFRERSEEIINTLQGFLSDFLGNLVKVVLNFLLMLIYLFLLLLNRDKFVDFLMMYIKE